MRCICKHARDFGFCSCIDVQGHEAVLSNMFLSFACACRGISSVVYMNFSLRANIMPTYAARACFQECIFLRPGLSPRSVDLECFPSVRIKSSLCISSSGVPPLILSPPWRAASARP